MSSAATGHLKEQLLFVCGEAYLNSSSYRTSLRDIVVSNLAERWPVRTHPKVTETLNPRQDSSLATYETISRANVFVFIFSKKTLEDSFYLNQYGVAKSYDVPVVGVRLTNYFLRNPLPEHFYRTEIVSNSGNESKNGGISVVVKTVSLADQLIGDFKNAMVYGRDFHKTCIERLLHKVSKACGPREHFQTFLERSFASLSHVQTQNKRNTKSSTPSQCLKCGFLLPEFEPPKLLRASSTGSLLRRSQTLEQIPIFENWDTTPNQKTPTPRNRTPLQPTTIQISSPQVVKPVKKMQFPKQGNWIQRFDAKPEKVESKIQAPSSSPEPSGAGSERSSTSLVASVKSTESALEETKASSPETNPPKIFRRQSRVSNGSWTDKIRNKLRRQSSLPVIPTTYLVTTPDGLEKQISLVKYPPEKREPCSPRGNSSTSMFSDDEDQETIHISRVPSPDAPSG